jgi:alpha-galactosidase
VSLRRTGRLAGRLVDAHGLSARIQATTDRRTALRGADFVVSCFQVGGREAYAVDMEIPRRYGVDQTVGDTLGPGGVFRGLPSMAALEEITRDMRDLCPDAPLLNYANPMSVNCWFAAGIDHQAWMLELRHNGEDVLPQLREKVPAYHRGELEPARPIDEWYAGGREGVRTAILELTG